MTREQWEAQITNRIKTHKGYMTIFWLTETQQRAYAFERLLARGEIRQIRGVGYPHIRIAQATNTDTRDRRAWLDSFRSARKQMQ